MISKFLIVDKQIFFSQVKGADGAEGQKKRAIKVLMPIEVYWSAQKLVEEAEYIISSTEYPGDANRVYKKLMKLVGPYSVEEKDRDWLYATWIN